MSKKIREVFCSKFFDFLSEQDKNLAQFSIALFMQTSKIVSTQIPYGRFFPGRFFAGFAIAVIFYPEIKTLYFLNIIWVLKHSDIQFEDKNQFHKCVKKMSNNWVKPLIYPIFG